MLDGLPDFQTSVALGDGPVWRAYGARRWLAPPTALEVAMADGVPAFRLALTRPAAPFLPPPPYAALDLTLAATRDEAAALAALREADPDAVLSPVYPSAASARLAPGSGLPELPAGLAGPIEPAWDGLGTARVLARLEAEAGTLIAGMVEDGTLPLGLRMALRFDGVSPRLPLEVRFEPAALLAALAPYLPAEALTGGALATAIGRAGPELPLGLPASTFPDPALAATLADRIAARFGTLMPVAGAEPELVLPGPDAAPPGSFVWDLSVPFRAERWLELSLDPFGAIRAFVAANGAERLVSRNVTMPVPAGRHAIWAFANLPKARVGLEALGVTLRADPAPPHRPHAAVATRMIEGPADTAELALELAPGEPLAYTAQGFAVIVDPLGVRRLDGPPRACAGQVLHLGPADFGLLPLAVEASADLLAEARLEGEVRYRHDGREHVLAFALEAGPAACALALPASAEGAALQVVARSLADGRTLAIGPLPARQTRVGLASFPGYGPQRVLLRCPPPPGAAIVALDLVAEDRPDDEAETLAFTAGHPEREWRYFAASPFRAGFRWRLHADAGAPAHPWRLEPAAGELEPMLATS
jgi:hypothetical protein